MLLILDMVNTWCCMFLLRYFCFFVYYFCLFYCLFSACVCRCRYELSRCSLFSSTSFFVVLSCLYFCLGLSGLIVWPVLTTGDVYDTHVPLTPNYFFYPFSRSYRVWSRPTMCIRGHPYLLSGAQPSISTSLHIRNHE